MATNTTTWNPPKTTDLDVADTWLNEMGGTRLAVYLDYAQENFFDLHGRPYESEEDRNKVIGEAFDQAFYRWEEDQA